MYRKYHNDTYSKGQKGGNDEKIFVSWLLIFLTLSSASCAKKDVKDDGKVEVKETVVEVDKNLSNVEITIPMMFLEISGEEIDYDKIIAEAKEEWVKEAHKNCGWFTYLCDPKR